MALVLLAVAAPARAADPLRVFTVAAARGVHTQPYDGAPATGVYLGGDIVPTADGGFLLGGGFAIHRVDPLGHVVRVAGNGRQDYSGDGGPARDASFNTVTDVAVTADGGFLLADQFNCVVRRVHADGTISTAAGRRQDTCGTGLGQPPSDIGDGGHATSATLGCPMGVSPKPDGGFLFVDGCQQRIRQVDPAGTIRTVVGTGAQGEAAAGYGGPATAASVTNPTEIAALADGGFAFMDQSGIHRVSSDGTLSGVLASGNASGSGLGLSEGGIPFRWRSGGRTLRVFGPGPLDLSLTAPAATFFDGDGDALAAPVFVAHGVSDVEPTGEGGLLFATNDGVKFAAPPGTRMLAVAVARESLPALARRRLWMRTTRPATVRVALVRRDRATFRTTVTASGGLTTVQLPKRLAGGVYSARLRAVGPDGAVALHRYPILLGSQLPGPIARAAHRFDYYDRYYVSSYPGGRMVRSAGEDDDEPIVERCRRFSARRIDCVVGEELAYAEGRTPCLWVGAARLTRGGSIQTRHYRCRSRGSRSPFQRHPRWTSSSKETASLSALQDY